MATCWSSRTAVLYFGHGTLAPATRRGGEAARRRYHFDTSLSVSVDTVNEAGAVTTDRPGLPRVGQVLRHLRQRQSMSLTDVSERSRLSISFLSAVERGQSDISLTRLDRLAQVLGHDLGSLLGYTVQRSTPSFLDDRGRLVVDRGEGIDYRVFRLPGLNLELITASFEPDSEFRDAIAHEGVDIVYMLQGELVLQYDGIDYPMRGGDCTLYSGAYPHRFRNESDSSAGWLSIVTGLVY